MKIYYSENQDKNSLKYLYCGSCIQISPFGTQSPSELGYKQPLQGSRNRIPGTTATTYRPCVTSGHSLPKAASCMSLPRLSPVSAAILTWAQLPVLGVRLLTGPLPSSKARWHSSVALLLAPLFPTLCVSNFYAFPISIIKLKVHYREWVFSTEHCI